MHHRNAITVHATAAELSRAVAELWIMHCRQAILDHGAFHVALAGGATPRQLYELLATQEYAGRIDWPRVHVYFGDERCVPPDHDNSNFHMADQALLSRVPVTRAHIHRIEGEQTDVHEAAQHYSELLARRLPQDEHGQLQFDMVLLGIGTDGHTASLFPDTDILDKRDVAAAAVYVDKLSSWRISLTYPVLENARQVLFLVAGEGKAGILDAIFNGHDGQPYPVERLHARHSCQWHIDAAAASAVTEHYHDSNTGC